VRWQGDRSTGRRSQGDGAPGTTRPAFSALAAQPTQVAFAGRALTALPASVKFGAMTDLQFARAQMGMSLAFHIIFATVGIGMPVLMAIAEGLHLRTGK